MELTPADRFALDYCAPRGIPLSVFLDQWSQKDRQAALQWMAEQNRKCSGCGNPLDECMSEDGPEYEAELLRCYACAARDDRSAKLSEDPPKSRHGAYIVTRRVEEIA